MDLRQAVRHSAPGAHEREPRDHQSHLAEHHRERPHRRRDAHSHTQLPPNEIEDPGTQRKGQYDRSNRHGDRHNGGFGGGR